MTDARCEPPSELRGKDGWHWVVWTPTGETEPYNPVAIWWDAEALGWCPDLPKCADTRELTEYRYLSPVLTPAEVAALRAERDAAVAERDVLQLASRVGSKAAAELLAAETELTTLRAEVEKLREALEWSHSAFVAQRDQAPARKRLMALTIKNCRMAVVDIVAQSRAAMKAPQP